MRYHHNELQQQSSLMYDFATVLTVTLRTLEARSVAQEMSSLSNKVLLSSFSFSLWTWEIARARLGAGIFKAVPNIPVDFITANRFWFRLQVAVVVQWIEVDSHMQPQRYK